MTEFDRFHILLHPAPPHLNGELKGCKIDQSDLTVEFPISFEHYVAAIGRFNRLYVEPDGSFVWVAEDRNWQLDGLLFDRNDHLCCVELKGNCERACFLELVSALEADGPIMVQDVGNGQFFELDLFIDRLTT